MSEPAIRIQKLSKRYEIRHLTDADRYFRHAVARAAKAPWRWLREVLRGGGTRQETEEFWALRDVSLEIQPGEVVGIIGRNGAGKSTLLKILSRITEPTSGRIEIEGRVASLLEVGTGFHPELTGRENIFLNGAILGMRREEIRRKFDEIVAFAEVERFLDTPVKRYSSGMYVRLAFAVAAHLEPEILLVDEVLAVGDVAFQNKCLGKMQAVSSQEGRTVLFVSHNMGAVSALTRQCVYLQKGSLVMKGPSPATVERYLGDAMAKTSAWQAARITTHPLQILAVRLFDTAGLSATEFEVSKGLTVELEYEVRRWARDVIVEVYLFTAEGTHLITLGDHDCTPQVLAGREPGRYRSQIRIPGNWLNLGSYFVKINSGIRDIETFDYEEALRFALVENTGQSSRHNRRGCFVPMLPWQTVRTEAGP